jgi:hypothetical protein
MASGFYTWPNCKVCRKPLLISVEKRYLPIEVKLIAEEDDIPEGLVQQWECRNSQHGYVWRIPMRDGSMMVVT